MRKITKADETLLPFRPMVWVGQRRFPGKTFSDNNKKIIAKLSQKSAGISGKSSPTLGPPSPKTCKMQQKNCLGNNVWAKNAKIPT